MACICFCSGERIRAWISTTLASSKFFNSYKSRRQNLLEASVVLIQALTRSPEQFFKVFLAKWAIYLENSFKQTVKTREFPDEEGYLAEKILKYKKKHSGYIGQLTKAINKIEFQQKRFIRIKRSIITV